MEVKRPAGLPAVDLHALLALAKDTAALAAAIHREKLGTVHRVGTKSSRTDIITEVDREAEQVIVGALAKARPDDAIVAEEGSARQGTSGIRWLVDPLDGSVNYVYGYPAFSVSIGVEVDGQPRVGVVHDSFYGRVYSAVIGRGAICDGVPLAVSQVEELPDALLATGFGYDADVRAWQAQKLARVLPRVRDIRRSGSASIDLCLLAAGQIDGYYEAGLEPWDYAAGGVIASAAGARIVTFSPPSGPQPLIVAANPKLIGLLIGLLREIGAIGPNDAEMEPWSE